MTIVTRGYGGQSIVTWGYGEVLVVHILQPSYPMATQFAKLNSKIAAFVTTNETISLFNRIIVEVVDGPVVNPPIGNDLQVIPTVSVSFNNSNKIKSTYNTINTVDAFITRVISEEPIVQVKSPSGGDLQVIPTVSVSYEKSDSIIVNHEISNSVTTEFIRIVAEEN